MQNAKEECPILQKAWRRHFRASPAACTCTRLWMGKFYPGFSTRPFLLFWVFAGPCNTSDIIYDANRKRVEAVIGEASITITIQNKKNSRSAKLQSAKWLGWKDLNPRNARARIWCLTTWRHPNIKSPKGLWNKMAGLDGFEPSE